MGSLWQKHGADTIPRVEEAMFPAQERRIRGVSDFLLKLK
jgi:GTP cyclohydrolase II